jgi:hypothetical protein
MGERLYCVYDCISLSSATFAVSRVKLRTPQTLTYFFFLKYIYINKLRLCIQQVDCRVPNEAE